TFDREVAASELIEKLTELLKQSGPVNGLVLDLRNNLGGDMPLAVKFSSLFIGDQNAVIVKSTKRDAGGFHSTDLHRVPDAQLTIGRRAVDLSLLTVLRTVPMVVLSNGSSASASEIT